MSTETILEKDSMVDELDKDFNTTVLKMLKELRKIQRKCKKKIMNKIETSIKKKEIIKKFWSWKHEI